MSEASFPTSLPTFGTTGFQKLHPVWSEMVLLCVHLLGASYKPGTGQLCSPEQAAGTAWNSVSSSERRGVGSLTGLHEPEVGACVGNPGLVRGTSECSPAHSSDPETRSCICKRHWVLGHFPLGTLDLN